MGSMRTLRSLLLVFALIGALIMPIAGSGTTITPGIARAEEPPDSGGEPPVFDTDEDGIPDDTDNCITTANLDQLDSDGDLIGDACDPEPNGPPTPVPPIDTDMDGHSDDLDNCPTVSNPDQADADNDGVGDVCDLDYVPSIIDNDGDGIEDDQDNCPGVANPDQERAYGYNIGVACYGDPTSYTIRSVSSATWESVPGVCYQLNEVNTAAVINVCDGDGLDQATGDIVTITIPGGVYELTINAPNGFTPESNPQQLFAVPQGSNSMEIVLNVEAEAATGLMVQSLDLDGNPISGGVYQLYSGLDCGNEPDLVSTVEAFDDGIAPFNNLQPGAYCVVAQYPPVGYNLPSDTTIEGIEVYAGSAQHTYVNFPKSSVPGNTQPGSPVTISGLADGNVSVTFATVIQGGETSATTENAADWNLPSTYRTATALVYNLTTTAYVENGTTVCVSFDPGRFQDASRAMLLVRNHGFWSDAGASGDPASGLLCGDITLSKIVAVAEPASTATLHVTLTDSGGTPITGKCLSLTDGLDLNSVACDRADGVADGQMTFSDQIPVGTYPLYWSIGAAASDYFYPGPVGQSVTIPEGSTEVFETVVLSAGVQVTVVDESSTPLEGACFALQGNEYGLVSCGNTPTFYGVSDGSYTLTNTRRPAGYERVDGSDGVYQIDVTAGAVSTFNAVFRQILTPVGQNVVVQPDGAPGVQLTFSEITASGVTTAQPIAAEDAPALPNGFSVDGAVYFDISTTATYTGAIEVCLPYDPGAFSNPNDARLLHYENGNWVDATTSNDGAGTVCGSVTSLSPFTASEYVPSGSLHIRAEDWYGAVVPGVSFTIYDGEVCEGAAITATTDANGEISIASITPDYHCVVYGSDNQQTLVWISQGETRELLTFIGERPEDGFIELELQDENGVPLTSEQLLSSACVLGVDADVDGADRACDTGTPGRIRFAGAPRTVWELSDYVAPYGYAAIDLPATISGFQPGETTVIGVRHRKIDPAMTTLQVSLVDSSGNPIVSKCLGVYQDGTLVAGTCDWYDYAIDGIYTFQEPLSAGDYVLGDYRGGAAGGGEFIPIPMQTVTIPAETPVVAITVTLGSSLVITSDTPSLFVCYRLTQGDWLRATCASGPVIFYGIPDGDYLLTIPELPANHTTTFTDTPVTIAAGTTATVDVSFTRRSDAALTITVLDENSNPLPDACFNFIPAEGGFSDCTDAQGIIQIFDQTGALTVEHATAPYGYGLAPTQSVDLATTQTMTIVLPKLPLSVLAYANNESGELIVGVCIEITDNANYYDYKCDESDSPTQVQDGFVQLLDVPAGDYTVTFYHGRFLSKSVDVTLDGLHYAFITTTLLPSNPNPQGLVVEAIDSFEGFALTGACFRIVPVIRAGNLSDLFYTACDRDDGLLDGKVTFDIDTIDLPSGDWSLIETHAPDGARLAAATTVTLGEVRPAIETIEHNLVASTRVGTNVSVESPNALINLHFDQVTTSGTTTFTAIDASGAPALPTRFLIDGRIYYNISTTATFSGSIRVCAYPDSGAFSNPNNAKLLHYENGDWVDVTTHNYHGEEVCGSVTSLSLFAIAELDPHAHVTIHLSLVDDKGQPVTGKCLVFNDGANDHFGCDRFPDTPDGEMTIEGDIPAGTYELEWDNGGEASDFFVRSAIGQSVTIPAYTTDVTATVTLTPTLRLNIIDHDANPIPGSCFSLTGAGYGQGSCMATQYYYNVPVGTYSLTNFQVPSGYERDYDGVYEIVIADGGLYGIDDGLHLLNTQAGVDVVVQPEGAPGVQLTFAEITTPGTTTVQAIAAGDAPALPTGFSVDGAVYFDISTTAEFTGAITLCLPYNPADFTNPADARLFHGEDGVWVDVTTSNDGAGTICGSITSFSPFAIAEPAITTPQLIISGFGPPVSNNGWNEVNPGSTVPLKFSVTKNGVPQTDRGVIGSVLVYEVRCSNPDMMLGTPVDITGAVKRTGSSFHVNWKTPLLPGRCYEVIATTSDGHSTSAFFSLKGSLSTGNLVVSILATLLHLFHAPGYWGN